MAHENLNKPHIWDEISRRRTEIREQIEISTQAKRELLWETAKQCAKYGEVSRSVQVETLPDGSLIKTVHVVCAVFHPEAAIKAVHELNLMDGDYAVPRCNNPHPIW